MCFPKSSPIRILTALAVLCLIFPIPAMAEEGEPLPRTIVKSTRFVDVRDLEPILQLLDVQVRLKPDINAIVLRGVEGRGLETAIKLIDALDAPTPSIEVSVFIVAASREKTARVNISEDLESAVSQLQTVFGYRGFELLDTVYVRVRESRSGKVSGGVAIGDDATTYRFSFRNARVTPVEDGPVLIRLDSLHFELNGTEEDTLPHAAFSTDVQVRMGQKAVIGKSTPEGAGETLILIVEAGIVQYARMQGQAGRRF